ncbi:MAG TPA: hypothetical protein VGO89_13355 [Streptomyces sp.]|jgi:hypothetical protein|nr:hypothetical protein [Streptomyces sp.]
MILILAAAAVLLSIIGWLSGILIRRERRRGDLSADGLRIEAAARNGLREGRRRARVGRDMRTASTDVFLGDR